MYTISYMYYLAWTRRCLAEMSRPKADSPPLDTTVCTVAGEARRLLHESARSPPIVSSAQPSVASRVFVDDGSLESASQSPAAGNFCESGVPTVYCQICRFLDPDSPCMRSRQHSSAHGLLAHVRTPCSFLSVDPSHAAAGTVYRNLR